MAIARGPKWKLVLNEPVEVTLDPGTRPFTRQPRSSGHVHQPAS
jgi:hypothetical protein